MGFYPFQAAVSTPDWLSVVAAGGDNTATKLSDTAFANVIAALPDPTQTSEVPLPSGGGIYIAAGSYLISETLAWKLPGLKIITDGPGAVVIIMATSDIPIVQVAGGFQVIGDITTAYQTAQTSAQTSAIAWEFGDDTVGSCFSSVFEGIRVLNAATGLAVNPAITQVAGLFSCWFGTIDVGSWAISAINFTGNNALGNANCTGCVFDNIYLGNSSFSGSAQTCTSYACIFDQWDELVINQLNIEHCVFSVQHALAFAFVGNAVVNALHMESLTCQVTGKGLLYASHAGTFQVNGMTVRSVSYTGSAENPVVFFNGTGPTNVEINGYNELHCTVTTPSHPFADFGTATACTISVDGIVATQTTANAVNAGAGDYSQFAGITGTATLAAGTVAVAYAPLAAGAQVELLAVTPGGTPGALYVSSVTPGTGFTITSTSALDTSTVAYAVT